MSKTSLVLTAVCAGAALAVAAASPAQAQDLSAGPALSPESSLSDALGEDDSLPLGETPADPLVTGAASAVVRLQVDGAALFDGGPAAVLVAEEADASEQAEVVLEDETASVVLDGDVALPADPALFLVDGGAAAPAPVAADVPLG
ncbi:hypothetical protein [Rathayibacter sp. VKM Ac-2760]|uniref:hypothetical protein n=1 Tax=Rathayibacter sp. VKM Ac-2760 TaxID=2609253 RepID=UPI001315C0BC|nr:hypothetical protein [Rathayibacter sp. VKM Ac-2760]QHC58161.1 hypothetical protein GSU72_06025 [Rathayibacter sp. VKM Ac-2760]